MFFVEFNASQGVWTATETQKRYSFTFEQARVSFRDSMSAGVMLHAVHGVNFDDEAIANLKPRQMREHGIGTTNVASPSRQTAQLLSNGKIEYERKKK